MVESSIEISGLKLHGYHGVYDFEREKGNKFVFDVKLNISFADAQFADNLDSTINYVNVIELVEQINSVPVSLIETLAYNIYKSVIESFPQVLGGYIKVTKLNPPISKTDLQSASAIICWNDFK